MSDQADKSHLTLLGHSGKKPPEKPDRAILETFDNTNRQRRYRIRLESQDFTSLCPVTGQPDYAKLLIEYVPDELCVETKSLKFYLASYRNRHGFNEEIVNQIAGDLIAVCQPHELFIQGAFASRGGIALTVEVTHPDSES